MATPFPFQSGQTLLASQLNAITTLPSTTKIASHTLVIADQGTRVIMNVATANTVTVNTSIFGAGDIVEIQNIGAGVCTVTAGTATVVSAGPLAIPQNGGGRLIFSSASAATYFPTAVSGVLQVVSTSKTDTFTTTAAVGSPVLITGLTATITPQSTTSKIYVIANVSCGMDTANNQDFLFLFRGGSPIIQGDANGNRTRVTAQSSVSASSFQQMVTMTFLDSPASIAALTYQVYLSTNIASGGTATINRSFTNSNATAEAAATSTITVMEISA